MRRSNRVEVVVVPEQEDAIFPPGHPVYALIDLLARKYRLGPYATFDSKPQIPCNLQESRSEGGGGHT